MLALVLMHHNTDKPVANGDDYRNVSLRRDIGIYMSNYQKILHQVA